ncbi:MAG: hypothetical protein ACYTFW_10285 [Planctomycetota bacterium]|jgi:hypothetical protein
MATKKKQVTIYEEWIDPARAEELLGKNEHNRRVTRQYQRQLSESMSRGEWKFNGDTIRIDRNGKILDGQHRLLACIESGITMHTIVVTGLDPNVFDTIDVGKRRNFADVLSTGGQTTYVHETASALRKIDQTLNFKGNSPRRTLVEMEDLLKKFPDVVEKVKYCRNTPRHVMPVSMMSACYTMFSRVNKSQAKAWVDAMISGEVVKKNAIHILREQLIRNKTGHQRFRDGATLALCIDCWHFWRAEEMPANGSRFLIPEEFPEIVGIKL